MLEDHASRRYWQCGRGCDRLLPGAHLPRAFGMPVAAAALTWEISSVAGTVPLVGRSEGSARSEQ
ncbi:MAG TPA: hypothetical protein VFC03_00040 [Acidimicrobiales bacterium]|nr:hypothetical protein [Acidimicrobiales bacterium]